MANFLGGAMRALSRSPKTAKFVGTLNHADLPRGWSDDPEIMRMAGDAWEELGTDSPFFRSFYRNSKLVDPEGYPIVFYHGSPHEDLDFLDPDVSRLVEEGGAAYAVTHPGMALAYLARPESRLYSDPKMRVFKERAYDALLSGHRLTAPDRFGNLRSVGLADEDYSGIDPDNAAFDAFGDILHNLTRADWKRNLRDLSDVYAVMPSGVPIPDDVLHAAASGHHAYARFLEDNSEKLGVSDLQDIFSKQEMGRIYPVYVNAERPLVVEGRPGVNDWTQTGQMAIDPSSLSPAERERLSIYPRNIRDVIRGYDTPEMLYPSVDYTDLPTDNLAAHLRLHTNHDALLSKGVHDGGGRDVPPSDVVAFQRPGQAKAASGPVVGTFDPNQRSMFRGVLPYVMAGGALAAPSAAEARLRERDLPVEEAWNPVESLALAPMGGFWLDAAMGLAPDLPEVPDEYYEAAQ
jgi:hypothetical protein